MENLKNENNISQSSKILSDFLAFNKANNEFGMNVTMFHGFLYALISSPIVIMPNDWMYVLFGGFPEFQSIDQQREVYESALALHGFVKLKLDSHEREGLLIWEENGGEIDLMKASDGVLSDFCTGYVKGYLLDPVVKNTFVELPDLSLAFFLAIIKLVAQEEKPKEEAVVGKNIDDKMRKTLQGLMVENYTNWEKIRELHLRKTYFKDAFYR